MGAVQGDVIIRRNTSGGLEFSSNGGLTWTSIAGGGGVASLVAGQNMAINAADPANPIVSESPEQHTTTLGGVDTNVEVAGLDPATEGDYSVFGILSIAQAATSIKFQINQLDTNLVSVAGDAFNGGVRNASWSLAWLGANPKTFAVGDNIVVYGRLNAKAGSWRLLDLRWYASIAAGDANNNQGGIQGPYRDSATAITSFRAVASNANGFAAGSFIRLISLG